MAVTLDPLTGKLLFSTAERIAGMMRRYFSSAIRVPTDRVLQMHSPITDGELYIDGEVYIL
jgi:hypothetical protein